MTSGDSLLYVFACWPLLDELLLLLLEQEGFVEVSDVRSTLFLCSSCFFEICHSIFEIPQRDQQADVVYRKRTAK